MPMVLGFFEVHKISWVPSRVWYRRFLLKIGRKYRTITKTSRSLPVDFTAIKRMFLRRVVFLVRKYSIPPSLFFNIDETGVNLLPCQKRTWGPSGTKQISVLGWGDKRQFIVLPTITAEGKLAGKVQIIWTGETDRCHPKGDEIDTMSDLLLHSHSTSHWTCVVCNICSTQNDRGGS